MARSVAKITVDILRDEHWTSLSAAAQRLYALVILTQPKLTLCGYLDTISPARWSNLAGDTSPDELQAALDELEREEYVVIDHDTEELVVRTFVKNDLDVSRISANVSKGFWAAWKSISSPNLRRTVVVNCPVEHWERLARHAPVDAQQMRRSAPFEREHAHPSERGKANPSERDTPHPSPSTLTCHLSPVTSRQPPVDEPAPTPTGTTTPTSDQPPAGGSEAHDARAHAAAELVARHEARRRAGTPDAVDRIDAWLAKEIPRRLTRHGPMWADLLHHSPQLTAHQLAQAVTDPGRFETDRNAARTLAAADAIADRNARRAAGEFDCTRCEDTGLWFDDNGAHECDHRQDEAT